jgi:HPt (histidine-containing phosphotransfer) domain-containing protein
VLAAGDLKQAHSIVHNLKGLAGNLEATELQAAAVGVENVVKGQTVVSFSDEALNRKLSDLEDALNLTLEAVKQLGPPLEKKTIGNSEDTITSLPPEQAKKAAERIMDAIEMGDVSQIKSIAEALASESDAFSPVCNKLIQLAEDFDLDGIMSLARQLNI